MINSQRYKFLLYEYLLFGNNFYHFDGKTTKLKTHFTYLSIDGNGSFKDTMHAKNGRLRWVDYGCAKHGTKDTTIANSECPAIHIFNS